MVNRASPTLRMREGSDAEMPVAFSAGQLPVIDITLYDQYVRSSNKPMSSITIRNLEQGLKERLRVRAARHGHSMEAEARRILTVALKGPDRKSTNLYERIRARVERVGGIDLDLPPRDPAREPPHFD